MEQNDNLQKIKKTSIKTNYLYNMIYQVFALITPLITTPYISRVLGSSGVGIYSFTYSLVSYFVLFGALGFDYYAQREIARHQGDKSKQSLIFWEIIIARAVPVAFLLIIYWALILSNVFGPGYTTIMKILTINIVATAFDIAFLFQGNEDFKILAIRNCSFKAIGIVLIFIFVRGESDVWIYALCQSAILIGSNLTLWTKLRKYLVKVNVKEIQIKRHILPTLRLFVPTIAISVYTMLDRTLIGVLIQDTVTVTDSMGNLITKNLADIENGYYEQSEKMVKVCLTVLTSLGTVMIPRNSHIIASGNKEEFKSNIYGALRFTLFLGIPIMFGLMAVANNFSPWFFGSGFEKVPKLIMMFSPLIIIIGLSNVFGIQYLLPQKLDAKYTIAICSGAVINLALNLLLIKEYMSYGACVATLIAEFVVTFIMMIFARKDISLRVVLKQTYKYLISGIIMFVFVFGTQFFLTAAFYNTIILIVEGVLVYFLSLLLLKDSTFIPYFVKIKDKFFKSKAKEK